MERHRFLRSLSRSLLRLPAVKPLTRILVRFLVQNSPLSLKNRERLFNFFGEDVVPEKAIEFTIDLPDRPRRRSLTLKLNLQDDLSRHWYFWGYSHYELGTTRLVKALAPDLSCVFDIGANIGYYTFLVATLLDGQSDVHGFEPWPEVFSSLAHNAKLNGFSTLKLRQKAMSDVDGEGRLFLPSNYHWTNASLVEGFTEQEKQLNVKTVRFDTYCRHNEVCHVDLVKVDVEGAELNVLRGMGALLDEWQPDIICEVLQPYEDELDRFFDRRPYRKFLITDEGLNEVERIEAHPRFRDYYLSCHPPDTLL